MRLGLLCWRLLGLLFVYIYRLPVLTKEKRRPGVCFLNKTAYRALLNNVETAQVFEKGSVKVWECRNCGHLVVGTKAPEICPVCNHPQSYFEVREENY